MIIFHSGCYGDPNTSAYYDTNNAMETRPIYKCMLYMT